MKKIFYLASIAALAFSSCAKDETTEAQISAINGGAKITAAMSADDTRTHLENVDGKYKFRWTAGDQLGVYGNGANTLNNALFVLDNDSDGQAVGVFTSQQAELKAENLYLAVYPRFQTSLFTNAVWNEQADGSWVMDYSKVKVQIPAKQKYQNATPYSGTVPAISTAFDVVEDGNVATLKMQPLVDYLFVNFRSTEAIKTIALRLKTEESYEVNHPAEYQDKWVWTGWGQGHWEQVLVKEAWTETLSKDVYFQLNGVGALKSYIAEDGVRYYLNYGEPSETPGDAHVVTIETDEAYKTIDCHNANTYAFTIPAAILGMNGSVVAEISVNGGDFAELEGAAELNYKVVNKKDVYRTTKEVVVGNTTVDVAVMPYENTIFWLNEMVDTDGDNVADARDSFIHNPNGDVIIENEAELLQYINEYNKGTKGFAGKDAFLCSEGSFDFSNIEKLAALYNDDVYETYFEDYLVEGFPCFNNYQNDFVGNGAVIENITLSSFKGIFGGSVATRSENVDANAGASISDVTFKNVTAASEVDDEENIHKGAILAAKFNGEIKNVSVVDADGQAIISEASVAQYNGLIIDGAAGLNTIFDVLNAEKDLNMKNWADVEGVQDNVFGYIVPAAYTAQVPALSVITIAEGDADEYAKLTAEVKIDTNPAVAVMIGGVNYWTGDSISGTTKAAAKTGALAAYQAVLYAEQLAVNGDKVILMNNMDLNYENLQFVRFDAAGVPSIEAYTWKMPTINVINGNSKWIANVNMVATGSGTLNNIAPFNANAVSNLTLNGVSIDIKTTMNGRNSTYVPAQIAGLALNATSVENVTVNDLAINAYRADSNNQASEANYADDTYSRIGWLVAQTSNIVMKNSTVNGVDSNVKGISALVAQININSNTDGSVEIYNSTAANVDAAQTSFTDYVVFGNKYKNYGGSAVAYVYNAAGKNVGVRFAGIEKPVFAFNAGANSTINVILDNKLVEQLDNKTYEE